MSFKFIKKIAVPIMISAFFTGCGGGDDEDLSLTVYNKTISIEEGFYYTISLEDGTYNAEITSSNNGVSVEWIGGDCKDVNETKSYTAECTLSINGQVKISNPTLLGLGGSEHVTVKIKKYL